jgi:hypothetical protein
MSESMLRTVLAITFAALSAGACSLGAARAGAQAAGPTVPADSAGVLRLSLAQSVELAQSRGQSARSAVSARDEARWANRAFGARLKPQLAFQGLLPSYTHSITPVVQPNGATQFYTLTQVQSTVGVMECV